MAKSIKSKRLLDKDNGIYMSMGDAARITGISKVTISRLEGCRTPDVNTLAIICKWIGLPMEYFFKKSK